MNIYYLPARLPEVAPITPEVPWQRFVSRARVLARDVWTALRRGGQPRVLDDAFWLSEETPTPRRPAGPARVIDLDAARRRRLSAPAHA
jgi:hypothetical protein